MYTEVHFERRYRLPRAVSEWVLDRVSQRHFFKRKTDALGKQGRAPLQRVTAALRMLAYGCTPGAVDEYMWISKSSALVSMKVLRKTVVKEFGEEYLPAPKELEMRTTGPSTTREFFLEWQGESIFSVPIGRRTQIYDRAVGGEGGKADDRS